MIMSLASGIGLSISGMLIAAANVLNGGRQIAAHSEQQRRQHEHSMGQQQAAQAFERERMAEAQRFERATEDRHEQRLLSPVRHVRTLLDGIEPNRLRILMQVNDGLCLGTGSADGAWSRILQHQLHTSTRLALQGFQARHQFCLLDPSCLNAEGLKGEAALRHLGARPELAGLSVLLIHLGRTSPSEISLSAGLMDTQGPLGWTALGTVPAFELASQRLQAPPGLENASRATGLLGMASVLLIAAITDGRAMTTGAPLLLPLLMSKGVMGSDGDLLEAAAAPVIAAYEAMGQEMADRHPSRALEIWLSLAECRLLGAPECARPHVLRALNALPAQGCHAGRAGPTVSHERLVALCGHLGMPLPLNAPPAPATQGETGRLLGGHVPTQPSPRRSAPGTLPRINL